MIFWYPFTSEFNTYLWWFDIFGGTCSYVLSMLLLLKWMITETNRDCNINQNCKNAVENNSEVIYCLIVYFKHKNHVWGKDCLEGVKGILFLLSWHYSIYIHLEHFNHSFYCPLRLYFHWRFGPYFLWLFGFYFHWPWTCVKVSSCSFWCHVHNIHHSLSVLHL